jgi:hypothetical protein
MAEVEETVEETTAETTPEVPAEISEEEKEFKNPQARARYLERENRVLEGRVEQLATAFQQLVNQVQNAGEVEQPAEVDASEDEWAADPLGVIKKEILALKRQINENDQRQSFHTQTNTVSSALSSANAMLAARLEEDRPTYESAYLHLFQVVDGEVADELPNATQRERYAEVTNRLNLMKLAAINAGRNPADDFVRKSKRFGWVAPKKGEEGDGEDAREQIRSAKKKTEGARSLSTLEGGSPKARVDYTKLKDTEFNKALDDGLKAGRFRREGNSYRTPPMRDLLPARLLHKTGG